MSYQLKDNEFFVTGRVVQGNPLALRTKDAQGNLLTVKRGPNAGQPRGEYYCAIAVPKGSAECNEAWRKVLAVAKAGFPSLFDATTGACRHPNFAFKITDGDSRVPDQKLNLPVDKEGFPGNYVFRLKTGGNISVSACKMVGGRPVQLTEKEIKTGDYVRVLCSVKANGEVEKPGVYLNYSLVEHVGYGDEILSGRDPADVFGTPAAIPQGASTTPITSSAHAAPAYTPPVGVQPAPDFLNPKPGMAVTPVIMPPPPAATAATITPPPPQQEALLVGANGVKYTRAQLIAGGWNDMQIAASFKQA
jgi:hypothetical protein